MLKELLNKLENKYNKIKQENNTLNTLLETTVTFDSLNPIPNITIPTSQEKITYITNECPDINEEKATIISKLIPINETYLTILYAKEVKTNHELFIIPTDKYLWIINTKNYGVFYYDNLSCSIIKNNLMSKIILLNNILLEVNGTNTKIEELIKIINNKEERNIIIQRKTAYLCGITPIYQKINTIHSGISIDSNNNIVLHTKDKNYKYQITQIDNYEILLDNQVYTSKKQSTSKTIGSFQTSCYQISIRITTIDKQMIILPILPPNTFGTKYDSHDTTFTKNIEFANEIINKLKEITPKY